MAVYSDVFKFRGEGAVIPWGQILQEQDEASRGGGDTDQRRRRKQATVDRWADLQLRWMVAPTLGMPSQPFQVFRRQRGKVPLKDFSIGTPRDSVTFDDVVAVLEVEVSAPAGETVLLSASRVGARDSEDSGRIEVAEMVAAVAHVMPASGTARMGLSCGGATVVQVSLGLITHVEVALLQTVVELSDWEPFEVVGLPFDVGVYDARGQGLIGSLTDPFSAAVERLKRGSPPIGWFPITETSLIAPDWSAPDPVALVKEVIEGLMEEIKPIFDGRPAHTAAAFATRRDATPDGSTLETVATIRPFHALTLPPSAEGPLALALGFGTAYAADDGEVEDKGACDYLVLATYDDEIPGSPGSNEIATFIPAPRLHHQLTAPQLLEARSAGLDAPQAPDQTWQDDAQVSWAQVSPSAAMERPTGAAFARADLGDPAASSLLPPREAGGPRTLLPTTSSPSSSSPPPIGTTPPRVGSGRLGLVDGELGIPIGSGVRELTYCVALVDLYGVWSHWEDRDYVARAPSPPRAGVVDVSIVARYVEQPADCPTSTTFDLMLDWEVRTPSAVHLRLVLFPTTRSGDSPGARPPATVPASGIALTMTLLFSGSQLRAPTTNPPGVAVEVEHVDEEGERIVAPGAAQGAKRRRYRVRLSHALDYTSTRWWGIEVWARTDLAVGPSSTWVPTVPASDPRPASEYAMSARAASPVPPSPPLVAQGPDVPLGSTLDAQGRSHTRIPISFNGANPRKVSVWEVSEAALRTAGGLAQKADDTTTPSERLVQLRSVYDNLSPTRRRAVFRRVLTVDAGTAVADVVLPRGSTDIHFYGLTASTSEGVESDWPQGGAGIDPHEYLHAVIAPRLVSPDVPHARVTTTPGGLEVQFSCLSRIPVSRFELFATRSSAASRVARSMGPPVAAPMATLDASWSPAVPAEQGMQRYTATATPALSAGWTPWFLRTVAVPVDAVGAWGLRGLRSPDSPVVPLDLRPAGAPVIAAVSGRSVRTDMVAFASATDAVTRSTPAGDFQIRVRVETGADSQATASIPFGDIVEVPDVSARPSVVPPSTQAPLVIRGPVSAGLTPLGIWWQRPEQDRPVTARVSITDPLGRTGHGSGTAPALHVDPAFGLKIVGEPATSVLGVGIQLATKAPRKPTWRLEITVTPRSGRLVPRPTTWSSPLSEILTARIPMTRDPIQVRFVEPRFGRREPGNYSVLIRSKPPFGFEARLIDPSGDASEVSIAVKSGRWTPVRPGSPGRPR